MMSCVMRSPSCSQTFRSCGQRGVLGELGEQVAQQQRRALHVAAGLLDQGHQGRVDGAAQEAHRARILHADSRQRVIALHEFFTTRSRVCNA